MMNDERLVQSNVPAIPLNASSTISRPSSFPAAPATTPPLCYRSFVVAKAITANKAATSQNRVTTWDSVQPFR